MNRTIRTQDVKPSKCKFSWRRSPVSSHNCVVHKVLDILPWSLTQVFLFYTLNAVPFSRNSVLCHVLPQVFVYCTPPRFTPWSPHIHLGSVYKWQCRLCNFENIDQKACPQTVSKCRTAIFQVISCLCQRYSVCTRVNSLIINHCDNPWIVGM